eukprot:CAMPEP_0197444418 /NCGR_PEP_ID=MMETSP1175-20131217/9911_1 /TAXON_ID=1003142 /ORGANISM="Triceratium dubium, Strain CCMP147" /LENGTH=237 /DNA_ID=CAMNT_0042975199 /DNA_START=90 /DNA_END=800 /DNA_ORIENTATION=+
MDNAMVAAATLLSVGAAILGMSAWRGTNSKPCHDPSASAVLITGGSRGIGRAAADYLISRGYSVLVTVRKQSQYDEMIDEAERSESKTPYPIFLDVTQDEHVPTAMIQLKSFLEKHDKQLVALINNAGINPEGDKIAEIFDKGENLPNALADPSVGIRIFETNVIGVGRVTKAVLPLLPKGGRIINIGSYFGSVAGRLELDHCYYEASKFALEGMTNNMRVSLKREGIEVVLIKPGN